MGFCWVQAGAAYAEAEAPHYESSCCSHWFCVSWLFVDVHQVRACLCAPQSPSEAFRESAAVFSGKSVAIHKLYKRVGNPLDLLYLNRLLHHDPNTVITIFEFQVDTIWKGPSFEYVYLREPVQDSCGASFPTGREFLVYSDGASAGLCGSKLLIHAQEDLDVLGVGRPPEPGTRAREPSMMRNWLSEHAMTQRLEQLLDEVRAERNPESTSPTEEPATHPQGVSNTAGGADAERSVQRLAMSLFLLQGDRTSESTTPTPVPATPTPDPTPTVVPTPTRVPATPTPQPTPTPASTPAPLAAAVTLGPTPIQAPQPVAVSGDSDTPEWLTLAVAGAAGVLVGVLATILFLQRRHDGV